MMKKVIISMKDTIWYKDMDTISLRLDTYLLKWLKEKVYFLKHPKKGT